MSLPSDLLDPVQMADNGTGRWQASESSGVLRQSPPNPTRLWSAIATREG